MTSAPISLSQSSLEITDTYAVPFASSGYSQSKCIPMDSTVLMEGSLVYLPASDTARHNHSYLISRRNSLSFSKIMLILASSKNLPPSPIDTDWNPVTLDSATFTQSHCVFDFIFQDAAILQNGFP